MKAKRSRRRLDLPPREAASKPTKLAAVRAAVAEQLHALATDVAGYLRQHSLPVVRVSTALLLAASLSACGGVTPTVLQSAASSSTAANSGTSSTSGVTPLASEVSRNLPPPGTYTVVKESVHRDRKGVYQFDYLEPGTNARKSVQASNLRLIQGGPGAQPELRVQSGQDPILQLTDDTRVGLIENSGAVGRGGGGYYGGGGYHYGPTFGYWYPFPVGGGTTTVIREPAYYDPPRTAIPPDGQVRGSEVSTTPKPTSQRVTGNTSAVSGRAGGTGSGSAVTGRNQASGAAATGGSSSGTRSSAGSSSGSSSSGVTAPRSGGFSGGSGASSGGSSGGSSSGSSS
ncbi:MAG: hypothetical protein HY329_15055 [Chloroflexi bacterium]|nr:hypothetical protein [Chloroflexota bacterium]